MTLHVISQPNRNERPAPSLCGSCGRKIERGTESVVFRAHHARCIDRALARVRDFA